MSSISIRHALTRWLGTPFIDAIARARNVVRNEWRLRQADLAGREKARMIPLTPPLRLHLGCGHVYKQGWVNIDAYFTPPCTPDLTLDLRRPLPFPDGSCAAIYSEHFFEHVTFPEGADANLRECHRLLVPGGLLSIGVPDPVPILAAYLAGTHVAYFDYFQNHFSVRRRLDTPMEAVNWLFRQGGEHQFIYDFPSLEKILGSAGFVRIGRREYDPARDSEARSRETIYVDAWKPL